MALTRIKSSNIADGTVAAVDIADDAVTDAKIQTGVSSSKLTGNLPALSGAALTNLTSANLTGALPAISGANLTGVSTDTSAMENNIAILAFKTQAANNLAKFNLVDQVIDEYKDGTGVTFSTASQVGSTATDGYLSSSTDADAGGTTGSWGNANTSHNFDTGSGANPTYGTGDDMGKDATSYNYNFLSHSSGTEGTTGTAMVLGNCRTSFTGVSVEAGTSTTGTAAEYYEWGLFTAISSLGTTSFTGGTKDGIYIAFGGNGQDVRILKCSGTTETLLSTYTTSWTSSQELSLCRNGSTIYFQVDGVTKYTVGSGDFNSSAALKWGCAFGRGAGARAFNNCAFRYSATSLKGISGTFNAAGTATSTANTALTAPTTGDIVMLMEYVGTAPTLGTDLKVYVSRNGDANWQEATTGQAYELKDVGTWGTNKKILTANNIPFAGGAGTDIRYKIVWANQAQTTKETRIHATSLAWA